MDDFNTASLFINAAQCVNKQEINFREGSEIKAFKEYATMKKNLLLTAGVALVLLSALVSLPIRQAHGQDGTSDGPVTTPDFVAPKVFQAAGPSVDSIKGSFTEYQNELGGKNNNNDASHNDGGFRQINWDGGGTSTTLDPNPMVRFLGPRGALITTPDGSGFVQAPPDGLATQFSNPSYGTIFRAFSQFRLFSAIGGRITDVDFFLPGDGNIPATTKGFGVVFTDVDQPDGSGPGEKQGNRHASTLVEYFGANGELLFSSFVPASPGDGNQSFFGVVFPDARIARVRITSGNVVPGADDVGKQDVVMMDDFIYGEPVARP